MPTDPKTLHKYLYAGGDPVNLKDPTGRDYVGYVEISTGLSFSEFAYALGYGAGRAVGIVAIVKTPCWIAALFVRAQKDFGKHAELPDWADHLCLATGP